MYGICCVPFLFSKNRLSKILFFKSFPKKTLRLWISKIRIWIWSEESTQSVDFMDSWSTFGFAPKNAKSVFGFGNQNLDFSPKTHPPTLLRKENDSKQLDAAVDEIQAKSNLTFSESLKVGSKICYVCRNERFRLELSKTTSSEVPFGSEIFLKGYFIDNTHKNR